MTVIAAYNLHRLTRFDTWSVLVWLNGIAAVVIAIALVRTHKRNADEHSPANLTEYLPDEQLEGPRLERVLGWCLFFFAIFAVTLPLYWLRENQREEGSVKYFNENAAKRGEELFSNESMAATFNAAKSLKCADCHGPAGAGGGGAPYTYKDPKTGTAYSVTWKAPALNTVLYRFSPQEVHDIITYGRQGTPMQAWGVDGGGPKNDQSVNDLVAYIRSIQLPPGTAAEAEKDLAGCRRSTPVVPKTASGASMCALDTARKQADAQLKSANDALTAAKQAKTDDQKSYNDKQCGTDKMATADEAACGDLTDKLHDQTFAGVDPKFTKAADDLAISKAQDALAWAKEWKSRRSAVTDGQLLFELNCARCHTKNWSVFNPENADLKPEDLLGSPGGGGSLGFNLRDGEVARRFADVLGTDGKTSVNSGLLSQIAFVINGSDANKAFGVGGIGSGRMPGQCNDALKADTTISLLHYGCLLTHASEPDAKKLVLIDDPATALDEVMIEQIVLYERCGLDNTDATLRPPTADYSSGCS